MIATGAWVVLVEELDGTVNAYGPPSSLERANDRAQMLGEHWVDAMNAADRKNGVEFPEWTLFGGETRMIARADDPDGDNDNIQLYPYRLRNALIV